MTTQHERRVQRRSALLTARRHAALAVATGLILAGCGLDSDSQARLDRAESRPRLCSDGRLSAVRADPELRQVLDPVVAASYDDVRTPFEAVVALGDPRAVHVLLDILRVTQGQPQGDVVVGALESLSGCELGAEWVPWTQWALAADVPAPPGYAGDKRRLLGELSSDFATFLTGPVALDLRSLAWGGVEVDGIPPLRRPVVVDASTATYLSDDDVVFGIAVPGAARAYPRRLLVVHELVDDVVGSVPVTLPYCTLCGTAVAYRTDLAGPAQPPLTMGTSGLLYESTKLMYDVAGRSLWTAYDGVAVSGPSRGQRLTALPLAVTTWGEWRAQHPSTTVLAGDQGNGRSYDREDGGYAEYFASPETLFPVRPVDARLPAKLLVLGVDGPDGPVAFAVDAVRRAAPVTAGRVRVAVVAGDLVATDIGGGRLPSRVSFWFAWSQFRPGTSVWSTG